MNMVVRRATEAEKAEDDIKGLYVRMCMYEHYRNPKTYCRDRFIEENRSGPRGEIETPPL
jgi:hypothetical protein